MDTTTETKTPWPRAESGFFLRLGWPPPGWHSYTKRAEQYRAEAWRCLEQMPTPNFEDEQLKISVLACSPDGRQVKPYSTVIEALLDVLTHCRIVRHLTQITEVSIKRGAPGRPGYLDVWLQPIQNTRRDER